MKERATEFIHRFVALAIKCKVIKEKNGIIITLAEFISLSVNQAGTKKQMVVYGFKYTFLNDENVLVQHALFTKKDDMIKNFLNLHPPSRKRKRKRCTYNQRKEWIRGGKDLLDHLVREGRISLQYAKDNPLQALYIHMKAVNGNLNRHRTLNDIQYGTLDFEEKKR